MAATGTTTTTGSSSAAASPRRAAGAREPAGTRPVRDLRGRRRSRTRASTRARPSPSTASGSQASTLPALQATEQQGTLPGGTSLGAPLTGLDPEATGIRAAGKVDIGQGPAAQNTSLAYVIDVSGSAGDGGGCGGDANHDGSCNTVLDCEIAAAVKLLEEIVAAGTVEKVAVVKFGTGASALDLDPSSGSANVVSPTADKDGNGVRDAEEALRSADPAAPTSSRRYAPCQLLASTGPRSWSRRSCPTVRARATSGPSCRAPRR